MINLQNAMLVALGFLLACLIAFMVAPAYRRRLERIATDRMRRALPLSEAEIRADKDRVRAESAVRVFSLERQVEQSKLASARQLIDLSRRDARINEIENHSGELSAALEEAQNARAVLELTITERLPKVELRLAEAKKLLFQRDREIATLTTEAGKSARALEEAFEINAKSRVEIERLTTSLRVSAAAPGNAAIGQATQSETALRDEVAGLRARVADQAAVIASLRNPEGAATETTTAPTYSTDDATVDHLRADLAAAERTLDELRTRDNALQAEQKASHEQQTLALKAKLQDQASEIARLKAAVAAYEDTNSDEASAALKDSKVAMKARIGSLQAMVDSQNDTIHKLRTELASASEKQARQAAQFVGELRKLGSGAPANPLNSRKAVNSRERRPLAERLTEPAAEATPRPTPMLAEAANDSPPPARNGHYSEPARPVPAADAVPAAAAEPGATESPPKERLMDRITSLAKA